MTPKPRTLWFLLTGMTTLLSSQIFFWALVLVSKSKETPNWILISASLAFFWAEMGAYFFADYYGYRAVRKEMERWGFLSGDLDPPQLGLKAGGAFFLLAFLFVVLVVFGLFEEGWQIVLMALLGFFLTYSWGAPPIYLRNKGFVGDLGRGFSITVLPAYVAAFLQNESLGKLSILLLLVGWAFASVLLSRLKTRWPPVSSTER